MRFDWYQATINDHPQHVLHGLQEAFNGSQIEPCKPLNGYLHGHQLVRADGVVARVMSGGGNGHPNAWASGEHTETFQQCVRRQWGSGRHYVTRFDAAEDFEQPGAFDRLQLAALSIADRLRLKVNHAGDWHRAVDGRTIYIGSKKSDVFVRLYEKGKQLRAVVSKGAEDISADWVRLEAQVRPQKDARLVAASCTPEEAWGFSSWTRTLCAEVLAMDVPRVNMHVWRESDDDRAFNFMVMQYGAMLRRLKGDLGDWACVGLQIGDAIEEAAKSRRRLRENGGMGA